MASPPKMTNTKSRKHTPTIGQYWIRLGFLFFCGFSLLSLGAGQPVCSQQAELVVVEQKPLTVEERPFNIKHPPGNMTELLKQGKSGDTEWTFNCNLQLGYDVRESIIESSDEPYQETIEITSIKVVLALPIVIYLPTTASEKLKAHEYGHATICKMIYDGAQKLANSYASNFIHEAFRGTGKTPQLAKQNAVDACVKQFCQKYHSETNRRVNKVSEVYDNLTKHGANDVLEAAAIEQALSQAGAQE